MKTIKKTDYVDLTYDEELKLVNVQLNCSDVIQNMGRFAIVPSCDEVFHEPDEHVDCEHLMYVPALQEIL